MMMMMLRRIAVCTVSLAAATTGFVAPAQAATTGECYLYNKRTVADATIRLWRCPNEPGANGRIMYHAELHLAKAGDVVHIRYRTTNNNRIFESKPSFRSLSSVKTENYYAGPDEVQACADIMRPGVGWEFACAWTANDPDS